MDRISDPQLDTAAECATHSPDGSLYKGSDDSSTDLSYHVLALFPHSKTVLGGNLYLWCFNILPLLM